MRDRDGIPGKGGYRHNHDSARGNSNEIYRFERWHSSPRTFTFCPVLTDGAG